MALKDLFNNYFYGKPGKRDFTEDDLPSTRLELFKAVLSVRRGGMINLNWLYLLIWIPAVLWTLINLLQLLTIEDAAMYPSLLLTYLTILAPLIAITGPFNAGISYVMRNWARDEHSFPFLDFKRGMKENWRQALLLGVINGLLPLVVYVCVYFYSGMAKANPLFYLPIALLLAAAALWVLSTQWMPTMMVSYRLRFGQLLRNSVIITVAALPKAALCKLITLALPIALLLGYLLLPQVLKWLLPICIIAYAVFMLSFNKLVTASFANALCEKYINANIDGAPVDIGLRRGGENHGDEHE